jgi:hypothetical protein
MPGGKQSCTYRFGANVDNVGTFELLGIRQKGVGKHSIWKVPESR